MLAGLLLLLLLGALAGRWAGERLHRLEEEREMTVFIHALHHHANRILNSVYATLNAANKSTYPVCSMQDLAFQRKLLFSAYHIKDIGRLQDDRLVCSTLLNEIPLQPRRSIADIELKDGTYIYADHRLLTPDSHGPIIGKRNANVVLSPVAFDLLHATNYDFSISIKDPESRKSALLYSFTPKESQPTNATRGENRDIQKTSCDSNGICVAILSRTDRDDFLGRVRNLLGTCLGALVGGSLGLGWHNYRNRDRSLISRLRRALAAGDLYLVYQPLINVADGKLLGFEALIRWQTASGDFVPADVLIANAEKAGLIGRVTDYVLGRVVADMTNLLRSHRALSVNINITANDLENADLMQKLNTELTAADILPQQIGLELTERTGIESPRAIKTVEYLRNKGHKIYIDDFGTGYSNLGYLDQLRVDAIKIDKIFTRTIGKRETISIIPQIISIASKYNLDIVVEGVETQIQRDYLRTVGVSIVAQGWFFGKPLSVREAERLVQSDKRIAV
nr:EAL domain-containing protein [Brucella intermedia]